MLLGGRDRLLGDVAGNTLTPCDCRNKLGRGVQAVDADRQAASERTLGCQATNDRPVSPDPASDWWAASDTFVLYSVFVVGTLSD